MDVFKLRDDVIHNYAEYVRSFVQIREPLLKQFVSDSLTDQALWPQPLIQMNPGFDAGGWIDDLVDDGTLHPKCKSVFRIKSEQDAFGLPMRLHRHQVDAIREANARRNYVLTTGTGSGKSLAYIVPIVDHVLRHGSGKGIQAIVVYPMNALCNSQYGELEKFLTTGFGEGKEPVRFDRYTGQESREKREAITHNPPDILLTNYVMLELLLTRPFEQALVQSARGLSFLVLDELHTYRGRQGADVALLVRRVREACHAPGMLCVGTSATMASGGTHDEQRVEIATVASRLFGAEVASGSIIGETLTRETAELDFQNAQVVSRLREDIARTVDFPTDYDEFIAAPIASWLEDAFGLTREHGTNRLIRAQPLPIQGPAGAAQQLGKVTGLTSEACETAIMRWLLAGCNCEPHAETRKQPFAFRLHQFISRGDSVFASPEENSTRHLSLSGQQFVPNSERSKILLPLAFCRECGAEYYSVWKSTDTGTGRVHFRTRELSERVDDPAEGEAGFLYRDSENPWPDDPDDLAQRLPDDWLEEHRGRLRVRSNRRDDTPQPVVVAPDGGVSADGLVYWFTPTPFRFCQHCGVSYRVRRGSSDYGQLATLASGGRSTATTILSLSSVRYLREEPTLQDFARKLLSFTDNRQDASLQAGHFNDFVEVSLLRSALYKAVAAAGPDGVAHDELTQRVYKSLNLPFELFAREPGVQFAQRADTERAFRNVLGYRLYRDQKRGWRVTSPNLEQCGLLRIEYPSLMDLCQAESFWRGTHAALTTATPETRERIAHALLDYLRRELAIDVDYLTTDFFERLQQQSSQRLKEPWAMDEQERPEVASAVFPRSRRPYDRQFYTYLSGRSGFGIYLGRPNTLPEFNRSTGHLRLTDKDTIIQDLFRVLANAGYVVRVVEPADGEDQPGYQLSASAMQWFVAEGKVAFHDPIRVPNPPQDGSRTNDFFVNFYKSVAGELRGLEAREHTAQVPYAERERRERDFSSAKLPVLYCSPTMELGVDIRQLNVVNMRNVPPTPANYAQRSGRAGRSGQPAFVLTYCTSGSSHDQYFFRQPERMVAGAVSPPRLDLANEDLVRAHVHAIWLAETGEWLGNSLTDLLDVEGANPPLTMLPSKKAGLSKASAIAAARGKAESVLETISTELAGTSWYKEDWLKRTLDHTLHAFEDACQRWRSLFRAAKDQFERQNAIIGDVALRPQWDEARRLRREAEAQLELLTDAQNVSQSDFYCYRYFASEGFLPGYNFPRLPLSAYIPARRRMKGQDEFLSRPRFLAISEFGPRSIIYHEGSRYIVNKVILPIAEGDSPLTSAAKQCADCGYMHELKGGEAGPNRCENCHSPRLTRIDSLLRLQNVATKRRDRISSDEEERLRMGYELRTGLRFKEVGGLPYYQVAEVRGPGEFTCNLTYGDAATIWRINLGWRRRANLDQHGFVLDTEKGYWQRSDQLPDEEDPGDPLGARTQRVVPFVEDRRNCLLLEPSERLTSGEIASLQAALKKAIQTIYQLEDNELATEPLPSDKDRKQILFFESAEGGAGVLRRILDDPESLSQIADEALRLCHFDATTAADLRRAAGASEDCEAACYDCLMSYSNQRDHELLDRQKIRKLLVDLKQTRVKASPGIRSFDAHLESLKSHCDSQLEKSWLDYLAARDLRLPSSAQKFNEACATRPDFAYDKERVAIYIDGPPHDFPDRQQRDKEKGLALEDQGITVLRFHHAGQWDEIVASHPNIFGVARDLSPPLVTAVMPAAEEELDLDLFHGDWHAIAQQLGGRDGVQVEPGGDVPHGGRVLGAYVMEVAISEVRLWIVDRRENPSDKLLEAIASQGHLALSIDPADASAVETILAKLEVKQ
ncbi:DEAD/DEAH box helicase [Lignipirellula cremea]|uniref:Putative ATP-dependent helicase Lhr n=1 Tax=Lignipirellula cremea TaxID=2528010 RepID=A0A518DWQ0_9BACT|nr:DEAD/DEAH box helicase [Lignipirellula cremea]QDU96253.1 putative ATP-dependent helicase Lhr [Lignipirellula cremea]